MSAEPQTRGRRAAGRSLFVLLCCGLAVGGSARAEPEAQLRIAPAPHYVGVPLDVHVHVDGLEREPEPSCSADPPQQGALRLLGIAPNFSSSIQILNGQVIRQESTTYTCQFQFTAGAPGPHRIGPFRVRQGSVSLETQPISLTLEEVPSDPRVRIELVLPDEPVYVGQHLPIEIEWWLDEGLQDRIAGYTIRSELFDRDEAFHFGADEPLQAGQQTLDVQTAGGPRRLAARVEQRSRGDRRYLVVVARRTLIPLRAGEYALEPAALELEEVTGWRRDLFGGRRAAGSRRLFARDETRTLLVRSAPLEGRPVSFAGAVGKGFSLEVSADRSVVQLGDPIALTVRLRGEGNLEAAGLPPLDADGGLSPQHFRLPEEEPPGELRDDAKQFRVSLRVLDEAIREIPALAYSWFDPELGEYQTTHSRPIALSVRPAQVISAEDVVAPAAPPAGPDEAPAGPTHASEPPRGGPSLGGADLSIEQDRDRLLGRPGPSPPLQVGAYGGGLALLCLALWLRRRDDVPPQLRRQREVYARQRRRIAAARAAGSREAPAEVAAALREIVAVAPALRSEELDRLLLACDEVIYAPAGSAAACGEDLVARAEALADAMKARLA